MSEVWTSEAPALHRYEVIEKNHAIKMEYWGGYARHNEIWRKKFDVVSGELIDEEFVTANHAIMMYQPLLEQPK